MRWRPADRRSSSQGSKDKLERTLIRDASLNDIPAMLEMAERFISIAWNRVGIPYDEPTCRTLLENMLGNDAAILLVNDDATAMIGALVHPWHFNAQVLTATELFWWAEPGSRAAIALWQAAERRADALGATTFNMASQHHLRSEALAKLYQRRGYEPSEHIFIRELA